MTNLCRWCHLEELPRRRLVEARTPVVCARNEQCEPSERQAPTDVLKDDGGEELEVDGQLGWPAHDQWAASRYRWVDPGGPPPRKNS